METSKTKTISAIISERIATVIEAESKAIKSINVTPAFEASVLALHECRGKVITTGIGKAGHIAHKFATTLCSVGTVAHFLHPAEAVHGDLGIIAKHDVLVCFSCSGKSKEVLQMLDLAAELSKGKVIGITSHVESILRKKVDIIIDMGLIEEPCPLGLTPSASIAVMLAISDALALALMEINNITREDYGHRHHGGYLGQKIRDIEYD